MTQEIKQLDEHTLSRAARAADLAAHAAASIEDYQYLLRRRDVLREELRRRIVLSCVNLGAGGGL